MNYLKFVAQVVAAGVAALVPALADGRVTPDEWINVGIIALGAVAVLGAGNLPAGVWHWAKVIVAAASAVLVALASLWTGGITAMEWVQLGLAALGALGVAVLPGPEVVPSVLSNRGE